MRSAGPWPKLLAGGPGLAVVAVLAAGVYAVAVAHFAAYSYAIAVGVIVLGLALLLAVTRYAGAFAWLLLTLPLSVEVPLGTGDNKLLFPSEALVAVLGLAFGLGGGLRRPPDRAFLRHPLTRLVLLYVGVLVVTTLTSAQRLVSVKFTLVNGAYVVVFYFMAYDFLRRRARRIPAFFFLYGMPMLLVISYALYHHATVGFYHDAAGIVVRPFFADHTLYSAALAMLLPAFALFGWQGAALGLPVGVRRLAAGVAGLLLVAIFFSSSRAAWLSVGVAGGFYGLLRARVRPRQLALGLVAGGLVAVAFRAELGQRLKMNRHSSTEQHVDLAEQTLSVTNISSDVSNAERLNRWSCAWRMFQDRPLTGFGPGTYQFEYLAYQRPADMTRISVTSAYHNTFGRGGSAHSEYLLALSESGIAGGGLFLALACSILFLGLRTYARAPDAPTRLLIAAAYTGLVSFLTHVLFNNFLNNNKAAGLFWGLLALLVLLDIRSRAGEAGEARAEDGLW